MSIQPSMDSPRCEKECQQSGEADNFPSKLLEAGDRQSVPSHLETMQKQRKILRFIDGSQSCVLNKRTEHLKR